MTSPSNTPTKVGPTGELAGARPTPLNTLEGTSMSTIDPIVHAARDLQLSVTSAADKYHAGELHRDEFVDQVSAAYQRHHEALASVPVPACPDWCDLPAGHPYDTSSDGEHGEPYAARWHKATIIDSAHFEVCVEADEEIVDRAGRTRHGAMGVSTIGEVDHVSADEARTIARAFEAAADLASGPDKSTQGND